MGRCFPWSLSRTRFMLSLNSWIPLNCLLHWLCLPGQESSVILFRCLFWAVLGIEGFCPNEYSQTNITAEKKDKAATPTLPPNSWHTASFCCFPLVKLKLICCRNVAQNTTWIKPQCCGECVSKTGWASAKNILWKRLLLSQRKKRSILYVTLQRKSKSISSSKVSLEITPPHPAPHPLQHTLTLNAYAHIYIYTTGDFIMIINIIVLVCTIHLVLLKLC